MPGTAPGLVCPIGHKVIYAVPGVPYEMREMMLGTILPDLRLRSGETSVIKSRVLKTWGMSESGLAETLQPRLDELDQTGNATIAFQASGIEGLKVRITAKAADTGAAEAILAAEEALVREFLGDIVFATDDDTLESVVLAELAQRGQTLAIAESLTGGLMAARMTAIDPGHADIQGCAGCEHQPVQCQRARRWATRFRRAPIGACRICRRYQHCRGTAGKCRRSRTGHGLSSR